MSTKYTLTLTRRLLTLVIVCLLFMRGSCGGEKENEIFPENSIEGPWKLTSATISPPLSNGETNLWKPQLQNPEYDAIRFETVVDFKKDGKISFKTPVPGEQGGYMDIVRDAGPGINFFCNPDKDYSNFFPKWSIIGDSVRVCDDNYHLSFDSGNMYWVYAYNSTITVNPYTFQRKTITTEFTRP